MTMNIHFDTGSMSQEEAKALGVMLSSIAPTMLPAQDLRDYQNRLYGSTVAIGSQGLVADTTGPKISSSAPAHDVPVPSDNDGSVDASPKATETKPTRTRKKADAPAQDGPVTGPEDDAATQAQDKADEQAEVEQNRDPETPLTIEDVKAAVGKYIEKFDMAAAQQDGPGLFVDVLGKPPEGQPYWKMSILPDNQETLKKVVNAWTAAAAGNARYQPKG